MPLIKLTQKGAEAIAQSWTFMSLENMDETPPEGLGVTMPLAHYLDDSVQPIGTNSVGVRLAPTTREGGHGARSGVVHADAVVPRIRHEVGRAIGGCRHARRVAEGCDCAHAVR